MSTTLTEMPEPQAAESSGPPPVVLVERSPEWLRTPSVVPLFTLLLGFLFWQFSQLRLWHTDVWGHLELGQLIWQTGRLPATEPFMPLSQGVPVVDTAWLSQLISYLAYSRFGVAALQGLFALSVITCVGALMTRIYLRTGRAAFGVLAGSLFLWLNSQQLFVGSEMSALARPQIAGLVCYVLIWCWLTGRNRRLSDWFIIPAIFALWANLHGSFVCGLALIGCFWLGRVCDLYRRTRSVLAVMEDLRARRLALIGQLCAAAALLNPYGLGLYTEVLTFGRNPNLMDLVEWEPLAIRIPQGQAMACVALMLICLYRLSPRRVSVTELLVLAGGGAWALWTSRMLVWWAVPAAYYAALHGHAVWRQAWQRSRVVAPGRRTGLWTVCTAGMLWIVFALTPFGMRVLHGKEPVFARAVSTATPVKGVEYLRKHPPVGQVFNAYEWGDFLHWAGPKGTQIFVGSHAHLVPQEVWRHYLQISMGGNEYDDLLDRYSVNTVMVDKPRRNNLINQLKRNAQWELKFDDGMVVIFSRKTPL